MDIWRNNNSDAGSRRQSWILWIIRAEWSLAFALPFCGLAPGARLVFEVEKTGPRCESAREVELGDRAVGGPSEHPLPLSVLRASAIDVALDMPANENTIPHSTRRWWLACMLPFLRLLVPLVAPGSRLQGADRKATSAPPCACVRLSRQAVCGAVCLIPWCLLQSLHAPE